MIFISYRAADSNEMVSRFTASLADALGRDLVFRDKTRLTGGDNWPEILADKAAGCAVMLVVIGPGWQTACFMDEDRLGHLRLHDPDDWVRKEIAAALANGRVVIPVLVNNQKMPTRAWLAKCDLACLADWQAVKLRTDDDYQRDLTELLTVLRKHCLVSVSVGADSTTGTPRPKPWRKATHSALQPAPHFAGREELLRELSAWAVSKDTRVRVRALVAAGGTGKTALAEQVLASLPDENPFGVLVWSFYDNPQTEEFLRAACEYFLGEAPEESGGLIERLQNGLRADGLPHLLILDGLELVQATGTTGRLRGELEAPLMKRFLRWLAAGSGTRTKALMTSRFPLPDLEDWCNRGFSPTALEDLDPTAARVLLRSRGVNGDDVVLDGLAESVHRHALTLDVLGLYLLQFGRGDPLNAEKFKLKSFSSDQKAEQLAKVLTSYAGRLPNQERDLLARLSLFPHGVTVKHLEFVIAGGEIAGSLAGCDIDRLLDMLEGLRELGLVFRSESKEERVYSAHPFLRDFFRKLIDTTTPEQVYEVVRSKLAVDLDERPSKKPTDPEDLDRYERLIEMTLLAGEVQKAADLFRYAIGGYANLAVITSNNSRGLRIVSGFAHERSADGVNPALHGLNRVVVINAWGLFAANVGDLVTARKMFSQLLSRGQICCNLTELEFMAGCWPAAEQAAQAAEKAQPYDEGELASLADLRGTLDEAEFRTAAKTYIDVARDSMGDAQAAKELLFRGIPPRPANYATAYAVLIEAETHLRRGLWQLTRDSTKLVLQVAEKNNWSQELAVGNAVMGRCVLMDNPLQAALHLCAARQTASRSGDVEVILRCYHLAAEIARHAGKFPLAVSEALDGIQLADSCGFGRWSLDIRTELASIHLAAGQPAQAIEPAEWVLKRSQEPECKYAWGEADALHLLGVAHAQLGETTSSREYLRQAIAKRKSLNHPGLQETQNTLASLTS
jgi:tetratricopeptide (TPR) repeat protein